MLGISYSTSKKIFTAFREELRQSQGTSRFHTPSTRTLATYVKVDEKENPLCGGVVTVISTIAGCETQYSLGAQNAK